MGHSENPRHPSSSDKKWPWASHQSTGGGRPRPQSLEGFYEDGCAVVQLN